MTNLSPAGLIIDNRCLGSEFLVTDVGPYFAYVDGQRTDKVDGYKYAAILPNRQFARLDVKIPGAKLLDVPAGQYIPVAFDDLVVKLYFDNNRRIQLTAKAESVHAIEADKPHGKS